MTNSRPRARRRRIPDDDNIETYFFCKSLIFFQSVWMQPGTDQSSSEGVNSIQGLPAACNNQIVLRFLHDLFFIAGSISGLHLYFLLILTGIWVFAVNATDRGWNIKIFLCQPSKWIFIGICGVQFRREILAMSTGYCALFDCWFTGFMLCNRWFATLRSVGKF